MTESDLTRLITQDLRSYLLTVAGRIAGYDYAEDIVQDAWLTAHASLMSGEVVEKPKEWLTTIVRRRAIDEKRKLIRRERHEVGEPTEDMLSFDPTDDYVSKYDAKKIVANADLTSEEIYAAEQLFLVGRSQKEVAEELSVTTRTIRRWVKTIKQKLSEAKAKAESWRQ
jgi:RNA polymerase sigma-70 factor (ECF subfamily)